MTRRSPMAGAPRVSVAERPDATQLAEAARRGVALAPKTRATTSARGRGVR